MSLDGRFEIPTGVVARNLSGEMVILDLERGIYFGLNPVGTRIWELLGEGRPATEICQVIPQEYDVGAGEAQADVMALLAELLSRSLIVPTGE